MIHTATMQDRPPSRVLAISGSSASQSIHQALLRHASDLVNDARVDKVSVRDFPAPIFSVDIEKEAGTPAAITVPTHPTVGPETSPNRRSGDLMGAVPPKSVVRDCVA